jgi:hypothetical protein
MRIHKGDCYAKYYTILGKLFTFHPFLDSTCVL